MNCEETLNLIDDFVEGELDVQSSARVSAHLLVCPNCAASYKTAQREKEIYASYLTEIAPPTDLWAKFQAKVNSESEMILPAPEPVAAVDWKRMFWGFFRLYPSLGFAALLLVLAVVWLRFEPNTTEFVAETKLSAAPNNAESDQNQTPDLPSQTGGGKAVATSVIKTVDKTGSSNRASKNPAANKTLTVSAAKTNGKILPAERKKSLPVEPQLSDREMQLVALEKAAARQIEKTELLLRSFRNARADEGDVIDLEYEREQARRLLEMNVKLRQTAENYGALSTLEILDRVEPFLLDIANLEKTPLPEKVSDIKERVKNQNIIASLQIY